MDKPIKYFIYCRKSTTDGDRQILSLSSQQEEMMRIADQEGLEVSRIYKESKSAKAPGREHFDEMLQRIEQGQAQGIICWKLDRLARNPVDEGKIKWLLQRGVIQKIITPGRVYLPGDNVLISSVEFGVANQYIQDLSTNVKRGMDKKVLMGWRPGRAPFGYKNTKTGIKGEQFLLKDPEYFDRVRQVFQRMLTGNYSVPKLLRVVNGELGIRLPATRRRPSKKITLSGLYKVLINPFYYGCFEWKGELVQGKHEPIITMEEFDRIQVLLGRPGRPRQRKHTYAFTGLIHCPCGGMVTAEQKFRYLKNGKVLHFIYYRCARHVNPQCTERAVELKALSKQIDDVLATVTISERFQEWAIKYLHEIRKTEANAHEAAFEAKQKQLAKVVMDIDALVLRFTSSENAHEEILTKDEYQSIRGRLMKERITLEDDVKQKGAELEEWVELSEKTFNFARYARMWFAHGDLDQKRAILATLGSDLVLKGKQLNISLQKPFELIQEQRFAVEEEVARFGPQEPPADMQGAEDLTKEFPLMSG